MSSNVKLTTSKGGKRVSKIRREPPAAPRKLEPPSREREIFSGMTGVTLFAIAIAIIVLGVSAATYGDAPSEAAVSVQHQPAETF